MAHGAPHAAHRQSLVNKRRNQAMNTRTRYDDDDDRELLKDGERRRVSMYLMDSVQRSVAMHVADAYGESSDAALARPGSRFASDVTHDSNLKREELYAFSDAERSAEWKGGLQVGDSITLNNKRYTVSERDADGRTRLAIDKQSAEEAKAFAYDAYDAQLQEAWRGGDGDAEGDSCTTADGQRGRLVHRNGALVCEPAGRSSEDSSLSDLLEQRRATTDAAYADYDQDIRERWRS